jgi:hypothetical protein
MTMAATQDRACSTSLMNKEDEALKRLATSAIGTFRTLADPPPMSGHRSKADLHPLAGIAGISVRLLADYRNGRKRGRALRFCDVILLRKREQPLFGERVGKTGDVANPLGLFLEISVVHEQIAF